MVAAQAYIDHANEHAKRLRRAQLQLMVAPLSEREQVPGDVRASVEAIYQVIEDRALRPVIEASTIEAADALAMKGFEIFIDLWPAAIGVLVSWLHGHPDQLGELTGVVRDAWRSQRAISMLGEAACEWFDAAQSARQALAGLGAINANADEIVKYTLLADFALTLGVFLTKASSAKPVEGLPLLIARLAHDSATKAFSLATQHLYADPAP
jgi:hypothetical protein